MKNYKMECGLFSIELSDRELQNFGCLDIQKHATKSGMFSINDLNSAVAEKIIKTKKLTVSTSFKTNGGKYKRQQFMKGIKVREAESYDFFGWDEFNVQQFVFEKKLDDLEKKFDEVYQIFGFFNNSNNSKLLKLKEKYKTNFINSDRIDNLTRSAKIGKNYITFSTHKNFSNFSHILDEIRESEIVALFEEILGWEELISFEDQKIKLEKFYFLN